MIPFGGWAIRGEGIGREGQAAVRLGAPDEPYGLRGLI